MNSLTAKMSFFLITYTDGFTMRETKYVKSNVAVFISNVTNLYYT